MHRYVGTSVEDGLLDLLHEHALPADAFERLGGQAVTLGSDDDRLDVETRSSLREQVRDHVGLAPCQR